MLDLLRDHWTVWRLKARQQRMLQEQLVSLTERRSTITDTEDEGWSLLGGGGKAPAPAAQQAIRDRVRRLVRENAHAANILRLLQAYVTGPGLELAHQGARADARESGWARRADQLWDEFQEGNSRHYSFAEHARRAWRDGEAFLQVFPHESWPPQVRFIDPEWIAATPDAPDSQGILTAPGDSETPVAYLRIVSRDGRRAERIPAEDILHTRYGVDANELRGVSLFAPVLDALDCYAQWLETEMLARKLQASIVLWRKVQGSPREIEALARGQAGGGRERVQPGTILTTNHGAELQYLQPQTNFRDAAPLGRMLLLGVAAGAGLPEFMLTADASNGNFASTLIAEGPAVKYFQSQQTLFASEFTRVWRRVMMEAIAIGQLPDDFFQRVKPRWMFPPLVSRDRSRERLADVRLLEAGVLSRAEVARRDGVDAERMHQERRVEGAAH